MDAARGFFHRLLGGHGDDYIVEIAQPFRNRPDFLI
jgi:hypothetical protein